MVATPTIRDPFTPGTGILPPYVAGRESILKRIMSEARPLYALKRDGDTGNTCGDAPKRDIVIHGPQGSGKTVLLRVVEVRLKKTLTRLQQQRGKKVPPGFAVMRWTPDAELHSIEETVDALLERGPLRSALKRVARAKITVLSFDLKDVELPPLRAALKTRMKGGPLVLLIDDAQELKPRIAKMLLYAGQQLRVEGYPFLLILAGTDKLMSTLNSIDKTFCERSTLMSLGPLSEDGAKMALEIPLGKLSIEVEQGAWPILLSDKHDLYAHYLQEVGAEAIRQLNKEEGERVNGQIVVTENTARKIFSSVWTIKKSRLQDIAQASKGNIDREQKLRRLKLKNKRLKSKRDQLERTASERITQVAALETQLALLGSSKSELELKISELESCERELESKDAELTLQSTELTLKSTELQSERAELESCKRELESCKRELESCKRELEFKSAELSGVEKGQGEQWASLHERNGVLETRNGVLETRNGVLESANAELESRNAELESRNAEFKKRLLRYGAKKEQHPMRWRWLFGREDA